MSYVLSIVGIIYSHYFYRPTNRSDAIIIISGSRNTSSYICSMVVAIIIRHWIIVIKCNIPANEIILITILIVIDTILIVRVKYPRIS